MSVSIEIIFAVMIVSNIIAKSLKISTELSMFIAAIAGGLVGGWEFLRGISQKEPLPI